MHQRRSAEPRLLRGACRRGRGTRTLRRDQVVEARAHLRRRELWGCPARLALIARRPIVRRAPRLSNRRGRSSRWEALCRNRRSAGRTSRLITIVLNALIDRHCSPAGAGHKKRPPEGSLGGLRRAPDPSPRYQVEAGIPDLTCDLKCVALRIGLSERFCGLASDEF